VLLTQTQLYLHLKKILLLTRYGTQTNILAIILLRNDYFKKILG
jgi:hypothetical protein